ncbi:MAG: hypothetical protein ABSC47_12515 [Terracidiphilus sp.]|jgi:threonine dehydratase
MAGQLVSRAAIRAAAALLFRAAQLPVYKNALAIVSGGNVDPALLAQILTES